MRDQAVSIDRRGEYYERSASLIAKDPVGFYSRAERGRRIQWGIRPKNLTFLELEIIVAERRQHALLMEAQLDCEATIFALVQS